jgi:hypothetical protein
MMIRDLGGNVRFLRGPYSPKTDDNGFCQIYHPDLERVFKGANIVGDGHWTWARDHFTEAHVFAPVPDKEEITKQAKKNNGQLRSVRGSVENIFGWIKENFPQLNTAWQEGDDQQAHMVWLLAAIYTWQPSN